MNIVLSTSAKC